MRTSLRILARKGDFGPVWIESVHFVSPGEVSREIDAVKAQGFVVIRVEYNFTPAEETLSGGS